MGISSKIKKFIALIAIILLISVSGVTPVDASIDLSIGNIERLDGINRIETSIEISKEVYPEGTDNVILVGYDGHIDALAGALLASDKNAPLIMTHQKGLTQSTKNEVIRLKAKNAYILGGENVVSIKVFNDLKEMGLNVKRLAGSSRTHTTIEIAKEVKGNNAESVFLVTGWPSGESNSLADALAIGPVSGMIKQPILLTKKNSLPKEIEQVLEDLNVKNITIIGGLGPVSKGIENKLKSKYNVDRVDGNNRESTAIAISNKYFKGKSDKVIIANGYNSIDALLGGYMGDKLNTPIIFSNTNRMTSNTKKHLYKSNIKNGYILGGQVVLSEDVRELAMNNIMKISDSNTRKPINIETPKPYASMSGQTTHPDVVYIEEGWNGHKYWMAHTPYHNTNEKLENPSVSYSDDGINFKTLKGAANPIDCPEFGLVTHRAHMSDTDMLIKPDGTMEVYYRYRDRAKGEVIYRKTSKDGIKWTDREVVIKCSTNNGDDFLSPALIYEKGQYIMWWIEKRTAYRSTSKTALEGTWSKKQKVKLDFQGKRLFPWHLDVFKDGGKYYLLLNANGYSAHSQRSLVLGESLDGLSFEKLKTIMRPTEKGWDNRDIYRGSIVNVNGSYKLYYSGMGGDRKWFLGLSQSKDLNYWKGQY